MSRGDEARRLIRIAQRLETWASMGELITLAGIQRRGLNKILVGLHEEVGLVRRKRGREVECRLMTRAERATVDRERAR